MITLHDFQNDLVDDARNAMRRHKSVLIQLSTGGGKTIIGTYMIQQSLLKGFDSFFIVHRKDLIEQTRITFEQFDIKHSYITASHGYNPYSKVHICSIDTLRNKLGKVKVPKIIFVDESHLASSPSWSKVIDFYRDKGCWVIGLSATPWRLSGEGLDRHFSTMVCGPSMRWLIDNGYLAEYRYFAPSAPDMSGVGKVAGDFAKGQMAAAVSKQRKKLVGSAVEHYRKHSDGMRAIAYCVSRKESEQTAIDFECAGISAQHIDGNTPMDERRRIIKSFANGHIRILCNVDLITTGFDLAAQVGRDVNVECIIQLRPTQSLSLFLQMVGRGLRADDKPHIILDHAGNAARHGLPCDDREWSLAGQEKKKNGDSEGGVKSRDCPECFYVHSPAIQCPNCGHIYKIEGREIGLEAGELEEITRGRAIKSRKIEQGQARTIDELVTLGYKRKMKHPEAWAAKIFTTRVVKQRGR
ncbi:MAG: DEAD/DEAH box helicase family protein [Candidatus Anammoxibacter sp.]